MILPASSAPAAEPAIVVRQLRFSYPGRPGRGPGFTLEIPHWRVEHGERVALHGPSGCGKSTVLDLIAGVRVAEAGEIAVEGSELGALSEDERRAHRVRKVGFVFQDFPLVDHLDARQNVLLPFRLHRALGLDETATARADELLAGLGLGDKGDRRPAELSQGERQRVAIARALVTRPRLLLADEPTAGLDPRQTTAVLELLEGLSSELGLTLVLVSHEPSVLARFERVQSVDEWTTGGVAR